MASVESRFRGKDGESFEPGWAFSKQSKSEESPGTVDFEIKRGKRKFYSDDHVDKRNEFKSPKRSESEQEEKVLENLETRRIPSSFFPHYTRIMEMFTTDKDAVEETLGQDLINPQGTEVMKEESYVDISTDSDAIFSLATGHSDCMTSSGEEKQRLQSESAIEETSWISATEKSPFGIEMERILMKKISEQKVTHILIVGVTGRGKSSFIDSVLSSLTHNFVSCTATIPKAEGRAKRFFVDGRANYVSQVLPDEEPYKVFCVSDEEMETYTTYELSEYQKKGVYIVRKNGKSIRAVINHILEKPIGKQLDHLYAQVEDIKNKKIHEYIAEMELCNMRQDVDETIHSRADFLKICDPEKYSELAKPFNLLHDRIVSLQNELMKAPGSTEPMSSVGIERRQVSESVKTLLMGSTEVAAFGYIHDILEVWLKHPATGDQSNSQDALKRQFRELLEEGDPYIFRNVKFTPAVNPGDKIYPTKDNRHFGTIGTFASSEDDLVGITISHVTNGRNETFVDGNNELEKLGDVELSDSTGEGNSPVERIAFVQIGASMKQRVNMQLNKDGRKLTSRLYTGNASLVGQRVLKKGASTQWTNGIITFDEQYPNGQGIIVGDLSAKFCEKGDSGSAIIRYSPDNPDDNEVEVISILSGAWESRETESVGTLSLQLRTPLERLGDIRSTTYQLR